MKRYVFLLLTLASLLYSCSMEADEEPEVISLIQDADRAEKCKGTDCTTSFGITLVHVISAEGVPIKVTDNDINVYYTKSKAAIEYDRNRYGVENDEVIIASDDYIDHIAFDGISITVEVNKDGYTPVSEEFVVTRDCCHVLYMIEPQLSIVLH